MGNPSAQHLIQLATDKESSDDQRAEAISLLGLLKRRRGIGRLLTILKEDNPVLSWASAVALGQIGSETAVGPLLDVLSSAAAH